MHKKAAPRVQGAVQRNAAAPQNWDADASEWEEPYSVYTNWRFQMWSLRLLKILGSVSLSVGDRFGFMT